LQIAQQYKTLAEKHGMTLPTMALAFVRAQPFVVSTIIGASSMDQLREDIASVDVTLSPDLMREINEIHEKYPNIVA
jgi:aryl-alcohol dehydrogenase-like predicted oxidoreductase